MFASSCAHTPHTSPLVMKWSSEAGLLHNFIPVNFSEKLPGHRLSCVWERNMRKYFYLLCEKLCVFPIFSILFGLSIPLSTFSSTIPSKCSCNSFLSEQNSEPVDPLLIFSGILTLSQKYTRQKETPLFCCYFSRADPVKFYVRNYYIHP